MGILSSEPTRAPPEEGSVTQGGAGTLAETPPQEPRVPRGYLASHVSYLWPKQKLPRFSWIHHLAYFH